jgi:hypothetical protein
MKIRALLFAISGIFFPLVVLTIGYGMGQTEGRRKIYIQRAAWLAINVDTLECIRTGDIAAAERRLRLAGCLEAMEYLENECRGDDSLNFILSKDMLKIEKAIPAAEKSVIEQRFEFLMKWKMLEKSKALSGRKDQEMK